MEAQAKMQTIDEEIPKQRATPKKEISNVVPINCQPPMASAEVVVEKPKKPKKKPAKKKVETKKKPAKKKAPAKKKPSKKSTPKYKKKG